MHAPTHYTLHMYLPCVNTAVLCCLHSPCAQAVTFPAQGSLVETLRVRLNAPCTKGSVAWRSAQVGGIALCSAQQAVLLCGLRTLLPMLTV